VAPVEQEAIAPPEPEPVAPPPVIVQLPPPDINAVTLIDAYEARNARLADRLREQLQAKLLIATSQADEAYKLAGADESLSTGLHEKAMAELEALREREIRAIGQDLYPSLVRLGLPGALRAMKKELADVIDVRLDVDPSVDSVSGQRGRAVLASGLRLVLYRFVIEAVRTLALAGASECAVILERDGQEMLMRVSGWPADGEAVDPAALDASAISIEAYAGTLAIEDHEAGIVMTARVPAPPVVDAGPDDPRSSTKTHEGEYGDGFGDDEDAAMSEGERGAGVDATEVAVAEIDTAISDSGGAGDDDDSSLIEAFAAAPVMPDGGGDGPVRAFTLDGGAVAGDELIAAFGAPARGLAAELELVQTELFGSLIVMLEIADAVAASDERGETSPYACALARQVTKATLLALKAVDADKASVSAMLDGRMLVVSVTSAGGERPAMLGEIEELRDAIRAADGMLLVEADGDAVEVTVRVPSDAAGDAADAA
jgi:hypothetical protein